MTPQPTWLRSNESVNWRQSELDLISFMAMGCIAVGFRRPRCASSTIFSATSVIIASVRSVNPSASQVLTKCGTHRFDQFWIECLPF